jgi:hypothetical protein
MGGKSLGRSRMISHPIHCLELNLSGHEGTHHCFRTPTSSSSSLYREIRLREENLAAEEKPSEIDGLPRETWFAFIAPGCPVSCFAESSRRNTRISRSPNALVQILRSLGSALPKKCSTLVAEVLLAK